MRARGGSEAKRRSSRRHFDRWARRYEDDSVSRWLAEVQSSALAALALAPGDRLLDVGAGTGAAVRAAAATVTRAVGVDSSPAMVARGRELAAGLGTVELIEADAEALPFADAAFTAGLCTTSLHHSPSPSPSPSPGAAIAEMTRVLAPAGRVVIADAVTDGFAVRSFERVLRLAQPGHVGCLRNGEIMALPAAAGLCDARTTPLLSGAYAIVSACAPPAG